LLDDLLDYNRSALELGMPVAPQPGDLATICLQEIEVQRAALPGSTIEFSSTGSTDGRWAPSRIKQLVANLVANAAKYGEPAGIVTVRVQGDDSDVRLSVENSGAAIPPDELESLFEPLRRGSQREVDAQPTNLGLGLFIVREVARAHGGTVRAESTSGRTTFTVTLPRGTEAVLASSGEAAHS
jgi:signal transduction histidine kinase